ncbi:hypothetical protein Bbelb_317540 [Branchiostoma belcheri]|nr:hypothetical protein Bbelb_317540 [Branchiostoma belcheri]
MAGDHLTQTRRECDELGNLGAQSCAQSQKRSFRGGLCQRQAMAARSELLLEVMRQKERELEESRAESGRLRIQERDQRILELEGRLNNNNEEPARKRARSQLYNTRLPWSSLRPSSLNEKKAALRTKFLDPCFEKLPKNDVKANVTFRTDDGFTVGDEWPKRSTSTSRSRRDWPWDQASLSDVWFHELHMKFVKVIPPLSWLQEKKREQNNFIPYKMEENARDGNVASRSVKDIIEKHLMMPKNRDLLEGDEPEAGFRYGLDGRPQAKNNIIGTVVACITPVRNPEQALARPKRTVREEYCVFLYSGKEDYEEQVRCGSRVFREIEEHLNGIDIDLGEERKKHVKIKCGNSKPPLLSEGQRHHVKVVLWAVPRAGKKLYRHSNHFQCLNGLNDEAATFDLLKEFNTGRLDNDGFRAAAKAKTTEVTRKKIKDSRGGVLLIDEAYRLAQADSSSKDAGEEALEELMSVMEGGDLVMIFAGYPNEMASFLDVNPGMKSRIAFKFHFPDYSVELARSCGVKSQAWA